MRTAHVPRRSAAVALLAGALGACAGGSDLPGCKGQEAAATPPGFAPVVWDNGQSTFFRFPGNQRIPVISALTPDGREGVVNSSVSGETVTVHQLAPGFVLRDGRQVACVTNHAYDHVGVRPGTGTSSPEVERVARQGRGVR